MESKEGRATWWFGWRKASTPVSRVSQILSFSSSHVLKTIAPRRSHVRASLSQCNVGRSQTDRFFPSINYRWKLFPRYLHDYSIVRGKVVCWFLSEGGRGPIIGCRGIASKYSSRCFATFPFASAIVDPSSNYEQFCAICSPIELRRKRVLEFLEGRKCLYDDRVASDGDGRVTSFLTEKFVPVVRVFPCISYRCIEIRRKLYPKHVLSNSRFCFLVSTFNIAVTLKVKHLKLK